MWHTISKTNLYINLNCSILNILYIFHISCFCCIFIFLNTTRPTMCELFSTTSILKQMQPMNCLEKIIMLISNLARLFYKMLVHHVTHNDCTRFIKYKNNKFYITDITFFFLSSVFPGLFVSSKISCSILNHT